MQTYPVFFHDWQGTAYREGAKWRLAPKQLCDHLLVDWVTQYRKIKTSNLAKGIAIMPIPSVGGTQDTLTLEKGYFGAWVLSIREGNLPVEKRELLAAMQGQLLGAIDRQLDQMFSLPLLEVEDFLKLPLPPIALSQMEPADCLAARVAALSNPQSVKAAQMIRIGLPASRVAPLVNHSVYWARQLQRHLRRIGLVPLPAAQQRLLDQPSLFGEA